MALVGRYNSLQVVKHTNFGLYLDGGADGEILLPNRYIPKDIPTEDEDWLNVFVYLDSEDKLLATTEKPKVQVGEFASLKVVEVNSIGVFLDWGLPKDLLLPYSEEKRQMTAGEYCVVHVYLDKHTRRITATARLDRYLDKTPANYSQGQEVDLLVAEATDMGLQGDHQQQALGFDSQERNLQVHARRHEREGLHQGSACRRQDCPEPATGWPGSGQQPELEDPRQVARQQRHFAGQRQERPGADQQPVRRQQGQLQEGHRCAVQGRQDRYSC